MKEKEIKEVMRKITIICEQLILQDEYDKCLRQLLIWVDLTVLCSEFDLDDWVCIREYARDELNKVWCREYD